MHLFSRLIESDKRSLGLRRVQTIALQSMAAICHLHLGPQIVHRDIKPEHIIISETEETIAVKLTDFEISRFATPGTLVQGRMGTFPFMAPEMFAERQYDPYPADIWSMGGVLLEVLCGVEILAHLLSLQLPVSQQAEADAIRKIETLFGNSRLIDELLVKHVLQELQPLLSDAQILLRGIMNSVADQRWTATDIRRKSGSLFNVAQG